jgi:uncharacterized membrane protein YuzA (DUF378 family)
MKNSHIIHTISLFLLFIGGINWGLVGLFDLDLVTRIFGESLSRIIFVLVGVAALIRLFEYVRKR